MTKQAKASSLVVIGIALGLLILAVIGRPWSKLSPGLIDQTETRAVSEVDAVGKLTSKENQDMSALARIAAVRESAGDNEGALAMYEKIMAAEPKSVAAKVKVAELLVSLGRKKPGWELLRGAASQESLPQELIDRIYMAMVRAVAPDLSPAGKNAFREATSYMLAAEELRRKGADDREIRPWLRPSNVAYAKAQEFLKIVLTESPDHLAALLSLGVSRENQALNSAAADAYRDYLRLAALYSLPQGKENAEVGRRLRLCETRAATQARLKQLVPGLWTATFAEPGQAWPSSPDLIERPGAGLEVLIPGPIQFGVAVPNPNIPPDFCGNVYNAESLKPQPSSFKLIELLPGGTIKGLPDAYWEVYEDFIIIGGHRGTQEEWANAGRLMPNGSSFEGRTLGTQFTKYAKYPGSLRFKNYVYVSGADNQVYRIRAQFP